MSICSLLKPEVYCRDKARVTQVGQAVVSRRSRGDGSLYWDDQRQRWIALVDIGFTATGKRRRRQVAAKTKTEAKAKLQEIRRDLADGLPAERQNYLVKDAVESWLVYGMSDKDPSTVRNRRIMAERHVIPPLGNRRLVDVTALDVDKWLQSKASELSTHSLNRLLSILRRSIQRAQAHDLVRRNVAVLAQAPRGRSGRDSKALTLTQAKAVISAAEHSPLYAYIVMSILTGARTEELRALTWDHLDLEGDPPYVEVWRSVRRSGDTKTAKSRRTLELPQRCVDALLIHRTEQADGREAPENGLVFCTSSGQRLDAANVRRSFRRIAGEAGLDASAWTPRELRHSFVSLMSSSGVPIEDISHLVGHASTRVTEKVYRKELRPVLTRGARAMDDMFGPE